MNSITSKALAKRAISSKIPIESHSTKEDDPRIASITTLQSDSMVTQEEGSKDANSIAILMAFASVLP